MANQTTNPNPQFNHSTRLTSSQILQQFPSWSNHPSGNIAAVRYGDIPDKTYTEQDYKYFQTLSRTSSNICYVNAFIYMVNGSYDIYKTNAGDVFIHHDTQKLMYGSVNIPYRSKSIMIHINLMYGRKALSILDLKGTGKVRGFCNKDGQGSPTNHLSTEEFDRDTIKKILSNPMAEYGYGIQKFMQAARDLYEEEPYNYIMEKTFEL